MLTWDKFFFQGKSKTIPCFNPNTLLPGKSNTVKMDRYRLHCFSQNISNYILLVHKVSLQLKFSVVGASFRLL